MPPHWTENDILVDGATFHYYRTGDGSKPALVLAHGFSDNGLCWLPVARDLEAEYDVILPDARGHGKSQRVQPGEAVDNARDLAGIIEGLGLERPVVGGHSMGGGSAAGLGARYPHLVRALILEDPPYRDAPREPESKEPRPDPWPRPNPWYEWLRSVPGQPLEDLMAKCRGDNPTWPEIDLQPWAESKQQLDLNILQAAPNRRDWREIVRAIACPTLLITAEVEKGAIVTTAVASEAGRINNNIQVAHITNAGHSIRRENYAGYIQVVQGFLSAIK